MEEGNRNREVKSEAGKEDFQNAKQSKDNINAISFYREDLNN
jgi:hypothetical protein